MLQQKYNWIEKCWHVPPIRRISECCGLCCYVGQPNPILGDPGADSGGEEKSKRAEKYGTKKSKERREEPLGTTSYQTSSKRSPPFWLLIGARKLVFFWHQSESAPIAVLTESLISLQLCWSRSHGLCFQIPVLWSQIPPHFFAVDLWSHIPCFLWPCLVTISPPMSLFHGHVVCLNLP